MGETPRRRPEDLMMESLRDACWPMEGSIDSVQLVEDTTRAEAIERFARDVGVDESQVVCHQECARILTRQEAWQRVVYTLEGAEDWPLSEVPDDWPADGDIVTWEKCRLDEPGATRVYLLEVRGE